MSIELTNAYVDRAKYEGEKVSGNLWSRDVRWEKEFVMWLYRIRGLEAPLEIFALLDVAI